MMPGVEAAPLLLEHEAVGMLWGPGRESGAKGKWFLSQTLHPDTPDFILPRREMWQDYIF